MKVGTGRLVSNPIPGYNVDKMHTKGYSSMTIFEWNQNKNQWLKENRGIGFEEVLYAIESGRLLDVIKHPNSERYQNQFIFYIKIRSYVYAVPFTETEDKVFLKTIFPDRKATKKYLGNTPEE